MAEKRSICLINDSFPPVIDGVANAVTNYALRDPAEELWRRHGGDALLSRRRRFSAYPFPVLRYPSIDMTKLVGYRAGFPLSAELMRAGGGPRIFDLIHSHCPGHLHGAGPDAAPEAERAAGVHLSHQVRHRHRQRHPQQALTGGSPSSSWWRTSPPATRCGPSAAARERTCVPWAIRGTISSCPTAWTSPPAG